jgi:hypothetical protein
LTPNQLKTVGKLVNLFFCPEIITGQIPGYYRANTGLLPGKYRAITGQIPGYFWSERFGPERTM